MPYVRQIVAEKANIINHNKKIYGSFAEIGAGQEVVNYFFKAGRASGTVAKSMSAYDMIFSDLIYGKAGRYVCEKRLSQMLNHEYSLLENRLKKTRGKNTCFFAFADTVAVSTLKKDHMSSHHGWMGVRFQSKPLKKYDEILLHVNLKDRTRLQQYEVLGVLGVNLIYSAFYEKKTASALVSSLVDNFEKNRIEIDLIKCQGPSFSKLHTTQLNLELMKQGLTPIVVLNPTAQSPLDVFYEKPMVLHTSTISPIKKPKALSFQLTRQLQPSIKNQIVHNTNYWYELKKALRQYTSKELHFCLSENEFKKFISEKTYPDHTLIQVMGKFFDKKTKLYVKKPRSSKKSSFVQWLEKEGKVQWV
ncbi:MAG: hypothetical protein OXK80_01655 [Bdellovibrionales bacterium]|nr:hypothetical protein [Bdellovibrionales bacterium]